jgi:hypothetical protein
MSPPRLQTRAYHPAPSRPQHAPVLIPEARSSDVFASFSAVPDTLHVSSSQEDEMLGQWAAVNADHVGLDSGGMRNDGAGRIQPQLRDRAVPHSAVPQSQARHQFGALQRYPASAAIPAPRCAFLVSETQVSAAHGVGTRAIVEDETVRRVYLPCRLLLLLLLPICRRYLMLLRCNFCVFATPVLLNAICAGAGP